MPIIAPVWNCGQTSVSVDISGAGSAGERPVTRAKAMPSTRTAMTASDGLNRRIRKKSATSGSTKAGSIETVLAAAMTKLRRTPANMPEATLAGMRETRTDNCRMRPVAISARAVTMNAPTASAMVKPALAPISARPGVDQAAMIGIR